jgi:hypothetical protein
MDIKLSGLIHKLENDLLQSEVRKSTAIIDSLLTDDFMEIGSLGQVYSKQDILEHLPKENNVKWEMEDFNAKEIEENVVLVTYKTKNVSEKTIVFSLRSSLWIIRGDSWKMVFHQGTPLN